MGMKRRIPVVANYADGQSLFLPVELGCQLVSKLPFSVETDIWSRQIPSRSFDLFLPYHACAVPILASHDDRCLAASSFTFVFVHGVATSLLGSHTTLAILGSHRM